MKVNPSIFVDIGLSHNEAVVYQALLEGGRQSAKEILPGTKMTRPNLYYTLGILKQKGLVSEIPGIKTLFEAANPKKLEEMAEEKVALATETYNHLQESLPELISTFSLSTDTPIVWHRSGIDGLKHVYKDIADNAKELLIFPSQWDRTTPELNKLIDGQVKVQQEKGIKVRVLVYPHKIMTEKWLKNLHDKGIETRIIKKSSLLLPSQILVWNDTIAITSFRTDLVTMMIQNEDTAVTFKTIFEALWATGSKTL